MSPKGSSIEPAVPPVAADPRLDKLRGSEGDAREREIAELIVNVARPQALLVIRRYARSDAVRPEDAEDIVANVELRLLARLRAETSDDDIRRLDDYVARLTLNALNDHFRRRFPQRTRLKNRLRYTLTHDARLALWMSDDRMICGLAGWEGRAAATPMPSLPERLLEKHRSRPSTALVALFASCGEPLPFEPLVDRLAELWHVVDTTPARVQAQACAAMSMEWRQYLTALWKEIVELRPMQRKALLFNLRDAETAHVLSLLVRTGIARIDAIAAAVEMTRPELEAIWNDLPLDDLRIAAMLGVTRQQVINLRKSARARLARRLRYERTP